MTRLRSLALSLFLLIVVCGLAVADDTGSRLRAGRQGTIISVSDIHFDPLLTTDKAVADKIKNSGYLRWRAIYSSSSDIHISPVGEETNYNLLASTLVQMKGVCPAPDFILFSGDLLAHTFKKYRTEVFSGNERAFRAFVKETLKFIGQEVHRTFPRVHVVFTLGNNDSYGDYEIEPNGSFLHNTMNLYFTYYLKAEPARLNSFASTFKSGGNYAFLPTGSSANRVLSINDIFFSERNGYNDYGWQQLKWLEKQLKIAKEHKQNVWIVFHIPPGVDAWSTVKEGHTVAYWDALHKDRDSRTFTDKFQELVQTYSPNIKGIFSGHTHMDHFRLIFDKSHNPLAYVHITPAISPQFGNNPGFQVLTYDAVSFSVTDFDTYYYDGAAWKEEYDFDSTYGKAPYDASNLAAIYNHLSDDAALRRSFVDYYDVHNQQASPITDSNWKAYWCGIGSLTDYDFNACYR
ncbi:MAG: metallophosphoesterase [Syntrophobacteraceae bacterium]